MYWGRMARNGSVTIPAWLRKKYGFRKGDPVGFEDENGVRIVKLELAPRAVSPSFAGLLAYGRRKASRRGYTVDEIISFCRQERSRS